MPEQSLILPVCSVVVLHRRQRTWASLTGPVLAKEDPGTDIQEDSSADKSALEDSKKKAEDAEGVTRGKPGGGESACTVPGRFLAFELPVFSGLIQRIPMIMESAQLSMPRICMYETTWIIIQAVVVHDISCVPGQFCRQSPY